MCCSLGLTVAIINVLQFPPKLSLHTGEDCKSTRRHRQQMETIPGIITVAVTPVDLEAEFEEA